MTHHAGNQDQDDIATAAELRNPFEPFEGRGISSDRKSSLGRSASASPDCSIWDAEIGGGSQEARVDRAPPMPSGGLDVHRFSNRSGKPHITARVSDDLQLLERRSGGEKVGHADASRPYEAVAAFIEKSEVEDTPFRIHLRHFSRQSVVHQISRVAAMDRSEHQIPGARTEDQTWRRVLATNLDGGFYCTRRALKLMPRRGRVINIFPTLSIHVIFSYKFQYEAWAAGDVSTNETALVRLADNRLHVIFRPCSGGTMGQAWSSDNGKTWTEPVLSGFKGVVPRTRLLSNGVLGVLVWPARTGHAHVHHRRLGGEVVLRRRDLCRDEHMLHRLYRNRTWPPTGRL